MKYIAKEKIYIDPKYLLTYYQMTTIDNIEGALKESFLNILADNSGLIMRTADLKNKYLDSLKQYENIEIESLIHKYSKKNYVQIFKNLTGSNVKNTTNLLRDKNVNWYYGEMGSHGIMVLHLVQENFV